MFESANPSKLRGGTDSRYAAASRRRRLDRPRRLGIVLAEQPQVRIRIGRVRVHREAASQARTDLARRRDCRREVAVKRPEHARPERQGQNGAKTTGFQRGPDAHLGLWIVEREEALEIAAPPPDQSPSGREHALGHAVPYGRARDARANVRDLLGIHVHGDDVAAVAGEAERRLAGSRDAEHAPVRQQRGVELGVLVGAAEEEPPAPRRPHSSLTAAHHASARKAAFSASSAFGCGMWRRANKSAPPFMATSSPVSAHAASRGRRAEITHAASATSSAPSARSDVRARRPPITGASETTATWSGQRSRSLHQRPW
jgi:hypothetical protein